MSFASGSGRMDAANTTNILRRLALGIFGAWLVTAAMFVTAYGQQNTGSAVDLATAVDRALTNDPQTSVTRSHQRLAELRIADARTVNRPIVQFTQSATASNNPVFVFGSRLEQARFRADNFALDALNHPRSLVNFRSLVSTQMPLFDQRQASIRVEQARTERKRADLQAEGTEQRIRFDVIRLFYGVILDKEMAAVDDGSLRSAEANRKKARDMFEVGITTEADPLAAEVEVANAAQRKIETEDRLATSRAAFSLKLGDGVDGLIDPTGSLNEKYFPLEDQAALIKTALELRPDYLAAKANVENRQRDTKAVKNTALPRVDAFGNFGYSSPYLANGSSDYTVGVNLTFTLFDPGHKARIAQAAEGEVLADSELRVLADRIRLDVVKALQDHKTAKAKIEASIKSISQAEAALAIVRNRYEVGLSTFDEVIRAELAAVNAKYSLLRARYDHYVSYAALLLATGQLTDVRLFY